MFSPIGWIILLSGGPLVIYQSLRHNFLASLLWVLAILPLALPLPNLLSIKYALPLLMFVPTFLMQCLSAIEMKMSAMLWPWVFRVFAVSTFSLLFVSISVMGKPPFFKIGTLASRPVGTHDGMRSYGGYLWQMATVYRLAPRSERQLAADRMLSEFLNPVGPDIVFVGKESFFFPGSIGWRHLQLELERSGIHGTLIAPHQMQFDLNDRRLTFLRDLIPDAEKQFERGRGVKLYDLRSSEE